MLLLGALLSVAGVLAMAPSANAAHHLIRIRQVYAGGNTPTEFVVLQLTSAGENQFTFGTTRRALSTAPRARPTPRPSWRTLRTGRTSALS